MDMNDQMGKLCLRRSVLSGRKVDPWQSKGSVKRRVPSKDPWMRVQVPHFPAFLNAERYVSDGLYVSLMIEQAIAGVHPGLVGCGFESRTFRATLRR